MTDLKAIAQRVTDDIRENSLWFDREVSFVLDGSHVSGHKTKEHIFDVLDTTKKNYGKRGNNLIAYCGNTALQDIYNVNNNQALSVWKYLSKEVQNKFNKLIKNLLKNIEEGL